MTSESPAHEPEKPAPTLPAGSKRPVKTGIMLLGAFLVTLLLHVLFDRFTPYTSEATVNAPVIGIAPNVSGMIVDVDVNENQSVAAGDVLFRIDPRRFEAAVAQAEAALATASQQVGASTAGLATAEARVSEATANVVNQREQTARILTLAQRNIASKAQADTSRAQLASAEAGLEAASAALEEAKRRLGPTDAENPQIRQALAQLQRARFDLADSNVRAPVDGVITNTVLSIGQFVAAGRRSATLIDTASAWIVANLPENALTRIQPGDMVYVTFNVRPGTVQRGRVASIASGVSQSTASAVPSELAIVPSRRRWLRDTQRIPVRIELIEPVDGVTARVGGRASVVVITQRTGPLEPLARAWLRFVSWTNYAF